MRDGRLIGVNIFQHLINFDRCHFSPLPLAERGIVMNMIARWMTGRVGNRQWPAGVR